jgi:putative signal transducing protein
VDDVVILRKYVNEFEARLLAAVLEANGIPVQVFSDTVGGAYPSMATMYPVRFAVRAEDAEHAAEILDKGDEPPAAAEPISDRTGPEGK